MEELVSCSICMETFDENVRPRSLPCGHTFCTDCINNGIEGGLLSCAHCKKQHQAFNGSDFPINYTAETLVSGLQAACLGAIPRSDRMSDAQPGGSRRVSKKMQALIDDQKDQLKSLLKISNETKKDITEYKSYLQDRKGKHTERCEKIHILLQNNREIIFQLEKGDKRVKGILEEVEEHQKETNKHLRKVDTLTNATYILAVCEELEKVQDDLEAWNEKCKMQLPCNETIRRSQKVMRKTTEALNLYEKDEDESASEDDGLLPSGLSIMGKIKTIETKLRMHNDKHLNVKIPVKSKSTMEILNRGQVFAVQRNGSHIRSGLISMSNGKTYLHCLRECLPPAYAFTIPYDEVIEMVNKDSMISFMDLSWEGSIKGRIHILLSPQTPLATHFYNLCTAQLGPSYLHTTFFQKYDGYYVIGGDYERDDGSGYYVIGGDYERDDGSGYYVIGGDYERDDGSGYYVIGGDYERDDGSGYYVIGGDYERDDGSGYYVIGGDYESNDGSGGAPIFQGLDNDSDIYRHQFKEGSVVIVDHERDGPRSAQFQINTYNLPFKYNGIFGQVQDGLDLVREAAKLEDIKKVRIEDCGIVLPF